MKSTAHLTELTLYVFLLFTVVNLSKARDGAVSHANLSPPISASNAAAVPPISASNAAVQPFSASRAAVPPISASNAAVQPFSVPRATVLPISASNAAIPPVSDPSAFPSSSRSIDSTSIDSTSIDSTSHSSYSDVPATIAEAFRRFGITPTAPRNRYSIALPQRKVDPTNVGESSRSSEPSDSPPWTIEYVPPHAWTIDYTPTPPPSRLRLTLKDWSSSAIAKYQSYFGRKNRPTASISLTEDDFVVVDKDMEKAKDEDDEYVVVPRAEFPEKEDPVD